MPSFFHSLIQIVNLGVLCRMDPAFATTSPIKLTAVLWSSTDPVLLVGDDSGAVSVYHVAGLHSTAPPEQQTEKLSKIVQANTTYQEEAV